MLYLYLALTALIHICLMIAVYKLINAVTDLQDIAHTLNEEVAFLDNRVDKMAESVYSPKKNKKNENKTSS